MHGPQKVLEILCTQNQADSFPNVYIVLRILLTLPVSVASGERSFSKLKLINTFIRSSLLQERLSGLATSSIEHEICKKLEVVAEFAKQKAHEVSLCG